MEISAEKVKELRERSGAGMMDCKRALKEARGDLSGALDYLRKEGVVKAAKKAGRATSDGLVAKCVSPDGRTVSLVEVNCETDFVARTDAFQEFAQTVAEIAVKRSPADAPVLLKEKMASGTVSSALQALIAKLGENMTVPRLVVMKAGAGERIGHYLHSGSKIGVLVKVRGGRVDEGTCRDIAMHVAAMHPAYLRRDAVPVEAIEREKTILSGTPELAKKPPELVEKIVCGKLARYYSEVCLMEQPFIKDVAGKKTVASYLKEKDPSAEVLEMVRFQVGQA